MSTTNKPAVPEAVEWYPARMLRSRPAAEIREATPSEHDFGLVILNQPLTDLETLKRLWWNSSFRVAADGGANRVYDSNQQVLERQKKDGGAIDGTDILNGLHVIIGDLDSLTDTTRDYFKAASPDLEIIHDPDQYSTDFTKAVKHLRAAQPGRDVVAMGGLGGRVDQGLSQLHHLYAFQTAPDYADGRLYLLSGESLTFLLKAGRHRIHVRERGRKRGRPEQAEAGWAEEVFGKYVGVLPVKEPSVITTRGLEWDVEDWPTELGGQVSTSNHVLPETEVVEVTTAKDVLFTISLKEKEGV